MHRDQEINLDDFKNTDASDSKITIYEKSLDWVITQQRKKELQYGITGLEEESLLRIFGRGQDLASCNPAVNMLS